MNIDKFRLHQLIQAEIESQLSSAKLAASQAYETATHSENKAENKYDTLGLEAAYLAEGQSKRVLGLDEDLAVFQRLDIKHFNDDTEVKLGALICLRPKQGEDKYLFISPVSGGTLIHYDDIGIVLITPSSPLGKSLIGKLVDDEIFLNEDHYTVVSIC